MDYLTLIAQQKQDKLALIEDEEEYTYAGLAQEARRLRSKADFSAPAIFIHESSIARQLIAFLAYSGTKTVPVIATEVSKKQQFCCDDIPQSACMGVMTSGSTGKSKLLWRSYHSWADFFPEQNRVFSVDEQTVIFVREAWPSPAILIFIWVCWRQAAHW